MSFSAYANNEYQLREHVKFYFFWSNLYGLGFAGNYLFSDSFSLHLLGGADPLVPVIWASPYAGNMINLSVKAELKFFSGCYVASGWYSGLFNLKIDNLDFSKYLWQSGPFLALGVKLPNDVSKRRVGFELGAVYGLPSTISANKTTKLDKWFIESQRSKPATGDLFPFLSIIIEM